VTVTLRPLEGEPIAGSLSFRSLDDAESPGAGSPHPPDVLLTVTGISTQQQTDHLKTIQDELDAYFNALPGEQAADEPGRQPKGQALQELVAVWRDLKEHERLMTENRRQEELLHRIFEVDPGGMAVLSGDDLVFRVANPAYRACTPDPATNPIGRPYAEIWPKQGDPSGERLLKQVLETGKESQVEHFELVFPGDTHRFFSLRMHPLTWRDEPGVLLVMWETTELERSQKAERLSASESLRRASELTAIINAVPDAILIFDSGGTIRQVNPAARELLHFDPTGLQQMEFHERLNLCNSQGEKIPLNKLAFMRALEGKVVRNEYMIIAEENDTDHHVMASASALYLDHSLAGAVVIWSDISELVRRRLELEALVSVASALRNPIVQDEMISKILDQVMALLKVEGASLLTLDTVTGDVTVRHAVGEWAPVAGRRLLQGEGITAQVLATGQPYLNDNILEDPALARSIFTGTLNSGACVPLSSHGQVIGAIWVGRSTPISESDVRLLGTIGDIAASNLFRASLFEQTQLRLQRISALHNIDMAITSSLDLQLTLSVLLDQVVSQMNVDAADILLLDPGLHWLEFASGRGFLRPTARMEPHRLSDSPAGQVALDRRSISISDVSDAEESIVETIEGWLAPEEGFRSYFASPLIAKGQVKGVIELFSREPYYPDREWHEFLDTLATQAAIAIDGAELFERLQRSNEELTVAYNATIEGWSHALELRDHETHGHAQRVTEHTIRLARRMGVPEEEIPHYRRGVLLHDIGKMGIPDSILLKDGPLTPEEKETMRRHPTYAYDLLHPIAYLRPALDIPYYHHEWWDGSGYPRGIKGEEIPLSARIFAVVDVWDALCSDRSYRPAWPVHKVLKHIRSMSSTHFDPQVVDEFVKMMHGSQRVAQQHY
jgi:PAS domain S-box-containing protein